MLPELLLSKEERGEWDLRFWSTACARGEEPYSLAILLAEFLGWQRHNFDISIYATDISHWASGEARTGTYTAKDLESISPHILQSYFIDGGQSCKVRDDIRQMVTFTHFDLTSTTETPFREIDCVFCCNVLIYWQKSLQERVLKMLYGSLATPGYLILGEVETPPSYFNGRLECLDSKARIYKKGIA